MANTKKITRNQLLKIASAGFPKHIKKQLINLRHCKMFYFSDVYRFTTGTKNLLLFCLKKITWQYTMKPKESLYNLQFTTKHLIIMQR